MGLFCSLQINSTARLDQSTPPAYQADNALV
jgi:hypothetical protein